MPNRYEREIEEILRNLEHTGAEVEFVGNDPVSASDEVRARVHVCVNARASL